MLGSYSNFLVLKFIFVTQIADQIEKNEVTHISFPFYTLLLAAARLKLQQHQKVKVKR
jgi:hypothetical protein